MARAKLPDWPALFTPPAELVGWLDEQSRQQQKDPVVSRHLLTIRWLVLAELDCTAPEPAPKPDFPTSQSPDLMHPQAQPQQETDSDHYIGTDGEEHWLSDSYGAACVDCGFEVGPDGYCEECGQDNNC